MSLSQLREVDLQQDVSASVREQTMAQSHFSVLRIYSAVEETSDDHVFGFALSLDLLCSPAPACV